MPDTKKKGNLTELQCIAAFASIGAVVSIPFGEDSRYDFIVDLNNKLLKIQCKSCSEILDSTNTAVVAIKIRTVRISGSHSKKFWRCKYSKEEIDYFCTFYNNKCYVVPVEECLNEKILRFISINGQCKGISFAEKYELTKFFRIS